MANYSVLPEFLTSPLGLIDATILETYSVGLKSPFSKKQEKKKKNLSKL